MRNPFDSVERGLDQAMAAKRRENAREREEDLVVKAYKKALTVFEEGEAIEIKNFEHYDPGMIKEDLAYVTRMEAIFAKEATPEALEAQKLATILEAIMHEQIELNEWMGPDVQTRKASRFDDIANGVDSVAEFQRKEGTSYLALALDVTYGNTLKKLQRIKQEIDNGKLSTIKYFESSDGSFQGTLAKVPRVIVGADRNAIMGLVELWLNRDNKALAKHPIQTQILHEIVMQLEAFADYAESQRKDGLAVILRQNLALVQNAAADPRKERISRAPNSDRYLTQDRVFLRLSNDLSIFTP